jgi:aryl-alcohol dehydrogenase-like predicted oxidoreductase
VNYRRFGRVGWQVSEVGYGMWGMGGWSGSNDDESIASLQRAVELGCNFFDTAWAYGDGRSEHLLGEIVRANPDKKLYTATKIPPKNRAWPALPDSNLEDAYPADHIEEYVHSSLKNAGLESFDLVQFHTWRDDWVENDSWHEKLKDLQSQGLIHAIGISINRWEPANALRTVRSGKIDSVQVVYNVFDQNPEDELFPACREADVAVIGRVPFDEGSLTGTLTKESKWPEGDWRNSYFTPKNLHETLDRVESLKALLPPGMSLSEIALRFVLSNPTVATTIPGMRSRRNVEINMRTSDMGPLDARLHHDLRAFRWDRKPLRGLEGQPANQSTNASSS